MTDTAYIPPPFDVQVIRRKAVSLIELHPAPVNFNLKGIAIADPRASIVTYSLNHIGELVEVWWPVPQ